MSQALPTRIPRCERHPLRSSHGANHPRYKYDRQYGDVISRRQVNAMTYARNTTVSTIPTRNEIKETLNRYGADGFAYATQGNLDTVIFAMENRRIRFLLELPLVLQRRVMW